MTADLPKLRPEYEKLLQESLREKFMRLAKGVVPEEDWEGFVFSAMLFGNIKERYPQYVEAIKEEWDND